MLDIERYTKHVQDYFSFQEYCIFRRYPPCFERILRLFKKYCKFEELIDNLWKNTTLREK